MTAARIIDPTAAGPAPERSHRGPTVGRDTFRQLCVLAERLQLSLAYVDRATVEAHLERDLTTHEWRSMRGEFRAMDFDDHVGDQGTVRTRWVDAICERAGVAGRDAPGRGSR